MPHRGHIIGEGLGEWFEASSYGKKRLEMLRTCRGIPAYIQDKQIIASKFGTANRHNQIINAITGKARQIVPPGAEVILFGSRARGDARDDSDWDVLILLDKESITSQDIDDYTYPLRELGWIYNQCINAILYTKKDWNKGISSPLRQNVIEEGIRLTKDTANREFYK